MSYDVAPQPGGGVEVRQNGKRVTIDPEDSDFCEFLRWASSDDEATSNLAEFSFDEKSWFYCTATEDALHKRLLKLGLMLHATEEIDDSPFIDTHERRHRLTASDHRRFGDSEIVQLATAAQDRGGSAPSGFGAIPSKMWVSHALLRCLNEKLDEENSWVRCVSTWQVSRTFVFVDVSDFSEYLPGEQALIVNAIRRLSEIDRHWSSTDAQRSVNGLEARLCIGDGYIYCFADSTKATYFAAHIAHVIEEAVATRAIPVAFHFRIGVHVGPVYRFWDPGRGGWNYVGAGINGGSRVLEAIGKEVDDVVFISNQVREELIVMQGVYPDTNAIRSAMAALVNRGRKTDKHGNKWRVYELGHMWTR